MHYCRRLMLVIDVAYRTMDKKKMMMMMKLPAEEEKLNCPSCTFISEISIITIIIPKKCSVLGEFSALTCLFVCLYVCMSAFFEKINNC